MTIVDGAGVGVVDVEAIRAEVARIAREVVAPAADAVDRENRFPQEAIDALREAKLLSLPIPAAYGGAGLGAVEVGKLLGVLAGADTSLGIVLQMHWSQLDLLARFGSTAELAAFQRECHVQQLLVASANSEISVRGNERASLCFIDDQGDGTFTVVKESPVISFGEHADAYFVTARRSDDAAPGDQVLAVVRRADATITPTGPWDTMGLRGSQSKPFHLEGRADLGMVMPLAYDKIVNQAGLPVTNVMTGQMWLGVAEAAASTAHRWVRTKGRGTPEKPSIAPLRLAELVTQLDAMRGLVHLASARFEEVDGTDETESLAFIQQLQTLKVAGTQSLLAIVQAAFQLVGLSCYRNGSEFSSLARQLRDAYGITMMVNNDSVLAQNAQLLTVRKSI